MAEAYVEVELDVPEEEEPPKPGILSSIGIEHLLLQIFQKMTPQGLTRTRRATKFVNNLVERFIHRFRVEAGKGLHISFSVSEEPLLQTQDDMGGFLNTVNIEDMYGFRLKRLVFEFHRTTPGCWDDSKKAAVKAVLHDLAQTLKVDHCATSFGDFTPECFDFFAQRPMRNHFLMVLGNLDDEAKEPFASTLPFSTIYLPLSQFCKLEVQLPVLFTRMKRIFVPVPHCSQVAYDSIRQNMTVFFRHFYTVREHCTATLHFAAVGASSFEQVVSFKFNDLTYFETRIDNTNVYVIPFKIRRSVLLCLASPKCFNISIIGMYNMLEEIEPLLKLCNLDDNMSEIKEGILKTEIYKELVKDRKIYVPRYLR